MTTDAPSRRCGSCDALLARSNQDSLCHSCQRARLADNPPEVASDFWDDAQLRRALIEERHMGHVVRSYRKHPLHGRRKISQETAARWLNISQTQLARIENGKPVTDLDRLTQWAKVLRIPPDLLWFTIPGPEGEDDVNRRKFLIAGGVGAASASGSIAASTGIHSTGRAEEGSQWLAWELWSRKAESISSEEVPVGMRHLLDSLPPSGALILRDADGSYSFAHPSLIDFFVAQRIFGDLSHGKSKLLADVQTSHDTDQVIRRFVQHDMSCVPVLSGWMRKGATPVLRVNSAGILAKLGRPDIADDVITSLRANRDTRHLYLTAVASRVLSLPWDEAQKMAGGDMGSERISDGLAAERAFLLSQELRNSQDGAARWCSVVLLGKISRPVPAMASNVLQEALRREPCRENLRVIAIVLSNADQIET